MMIFIMIDRIYLFIYLLWWWLVKLVGFFDEASSSGNTLFQKLAGALTDDFRFAHTFNAEVKAKYSYDKWVYMMIVDYLME